MRENLLEKLNGLKQQHFIQEARLESWLNTFSEKNQQSIILLKQYNEHALFWIMRWCDDFHTQMNNTSIFNDVSLYKTPDMILKRKRSELKIFFDLQYRLLPFGIQDVTTSPFMPAHMISILAAELICLPDESVCQIVMPWVEHVLGGADEWDIKASTENAYGKFLPAQFMMDADKKTLISILDYLDYVRDSDTVAHDFFKNVSRELFIKRSLSVHALNYIRALRYFYIQRTQNPNNFGFHVFHFATALHEKSANRKGTDKLAHTDHDEVLSQFMDLWKSLSHQMRDNINKSARASAYPDKRFEDFLMAVFDQSRIIRCSATLSSCFFELLEQSPDWYCLDVTVSAQAPLYTSQDLLSLREKLQMSLEDESRHYTCNDFLNNSVKMYHQTQYEKFIAVSDLLMILSDEQLASFDQGLEKFCTSAEKVFSFLNYCRSDAERSQCWHALEPFWRSFFTTPDDIILLSHYFHGMESCDSDFYLKSVHAFLSSEQSFSQLNRLKNYCRPLSLDFNKVCESFLVGITIHAQALISSVPIFLKCLSAFQSEESLKNWLDILTIQGVVRKLFANHTEPKKGKNLVEFLTALHLDNQFYSWQIYSVMIIQSVFQIVLPMLITHEYVEEDWHPESSNCCTLFLLKNRGKTIYEKLTMMQQCVSSGKITEVEGSFDRVKWLFQVMKQNPNNRFIKNVQTHFCDHFFEETGKWLNAIYTGFYFEKKTVVNALKY